MFPIERSTGKKLPRGGTAILLKTLGVKKFSKKMKIYLDKSLFCDTIVFVDKCAPI